MPPCSPRCDSLEALDDALERIGTPAVLKTRRLGYDGKGQAVIRDPLLAEDAWRGGRRGARACSRRSCAFDRELSIVAVRGRDGETACYPLVENHHREGILRLSLARRRRTSIRALQAGREAHARVGRWTRSATSACSRSSCSRSGSGCSRNEMAPRVHNSGHWTIEGAETSQFENHLRAVAGLPLGLDRARSA